ncbi:hypothetical protein Tco_1185387 [Tanacetum coccineum]
MSALHKITNTCYLIRFINEWADINRTKGSKGAFCLSFDNLAAFFPPMEVPLCNYPLIPSDPKAIIINKSFLFNETMISKLRPKGLLVDPNNELERLRWFEHVKRRPQQAPVRKVEALIVDSKRRRGRPKLTWEDRRKLDMKKLLLSNDMTSDRNAWIDMISIGE